MKKACTMFFGVFLLISVQAVEFSQYRLDVDRTTSKNYWCINELEFYGQNGVKLVTNPSFGSAQTHHVAHLHNGVASNTFEASNAFNGHTTGKADTNDGNHYCSNVKWITGWLAYDFKTPTKIRSYSIVSSHYHAPVSWIFAGSNDGFTWTELDTQIGHKTWAYSDKEMKKFDLTAGSTTPNTNVPIDLEFTQCRLDVDKVMGKGKWCLEELEFYGQNDEKLARNPSFGSAQTEYGSVYIGKGRPDLEMVASRAFDGITGKRDTDDTYYCSKTKWGTGWLAYDFKTPTKIIAYSIEYLHGNSPYYAPESWTFECSNDGLSWTELDNQNGYKFGKWADGGIKKFYLTPPCAPGDAELQKACKCNGQDCGKGKYCYDGECSTTPNTNVPISCIDDNSADAWLPDYSCEQLLSFGWCDDDVTYAEQTQERCPLACGKCKKEVLACSDFGAVQECDSPNGGACQIGCDIARCPGGRCDQRFAKTCICNGATTSSFADKSGGKYCTENWGPINVAKTKGGTLDECMDRCSNDNSCKAITYANTINPAYHKDCMLCTGIKVSRSSGYDTYIKGAAISTGATAGEPGQCWQFGCSNPTCNSGTCGNDNTPPSGCVAPSCAGPISCIDDNSVNAWLSDYSCEQLVMYGWCDDGETHAEQTQERCCLSCEEWAIPNSCIDDNLEDAWIPNFTCEGLKNIGWCEDAEYGEKTQERCPLICGKCTVAPAASDSFADGLEEKYCSGNWPREYRASSAADTVDQCMTRCLNDNSCLAITYGNEDGNYQKLCVLCLTSITVADYSAWTTYVKKESTEEADVGTPNSNNSCIDDNSEDAWIPNFTCEGLKKINSCEDAEYGEKTQERCPLTCGKCTNESTCGFGDHILEEACQCNGNACRKGEYCYNDGCKTTPNTNVPDCADASIVRSACKCADETICPAGTYCWDDQCQNEKYISECQSAGFISTPCQCGDAGLCGRNTYCYNNKCNTIPQKCSGYEVSPIPDVCICGGVVCSGGLHCWNGGAGDQCQIDAQPKECGDGGKNEATCMCGASKCSKGFYCWPGQICVPVPPTCGGNTDTAAISSECSCGGSSCGWGKFCVAGQCSETKKPSTPECELGEVATECICGGDECSNGEFCYNGMCNAKASSCAETPFLPLDYACDCGGILCDTSNYCYDGVCRNEPRAESCKSSAVEPLKETCHCGTAGECPKGDFCHQMECKKEPVGCKENAFQPVEEKCMCGSVECTGYCFDGECEDQPRPECKSGLVVSNNWPKHWKEEGMYFAVDDALAQKFFKSTNWSSNEKDIINSRGYRGKIKVWKNSKNCGNCGRYHPWAEKQAGDWQVGDVICDDPQNIPIQPTAAPHPIEECEKSLQATHGHPGNYLGTGKFFGFDNKCANKFFGTTKWHNKKVTVMVKTGKNAFKPAKIHFFKDGANCKMSCARWSPNSLSKEGDWNLNDLIFHAPTNLPEHPIEKCDAELLVTYNYPGLYKAEGQFMTFDNECMSRFVKKENFHWKKLAVIVNGDYSNTRVIRVLKDSSLCGHKSCSRIEPIGDSSAMDWKSGDILRLPSCDFKNGGCNENASCSVVKKKMSCKCKSGFAGDGYVCAVDKTLLPHPIELCKTSLQVVDNWPSKWGKEGQFFAFDSKCMDVFYGSSKWDWKKMMVSAPDGSEVKVVFFKNTAGDSNENVCGGTPCGRIDPRDNSASGDWPWGSYVKQVDHGLVPQTTEQCQSQLQITGIRPVDFEQEGKWFEFENDCMTAFFGTKYWGWKKFSITVNGETRKVAFFKNLEMCGMRSCGRVDPKGAAKVGDWSMGDVLVKTGATEEADVESEVGKNSNTHVGSLNTMIVFMLISLCAALGFYFGRQQSGKKNKYKLLVGGNEETKEAGVEPLVELTYQTLQ